jgi:hypothetical protein
MKRSRSQKPLHTPIVDHVQLDLAFNRTVHKLQTELYRFYIVFALTQQKHEKIKEFFDLQGQYLYLFDEWRPWFGEQWLLLVESAQV